ncbi:MAG: translation initiation factor IF-2 [Clostridia bacterium]
MGKIKVQELAKEFNLSDVETIGKLKSLGIEVKTHLSSITDDEYAKFKSSAKTSINNTEPKKSVDLKKVEQTPHIIRRNVKVISTTNEKNEIEQITTNISGEIKKSHQTVSNEKNISEKSYNRDGLGVVKPRYNNSNNRGYSNNRTSNVVVTRNGKSIDESIKSEPISPIVNEDVKENINMNVAIKEEIKEVKIPVTQLKDNNTIETLKPNSDITDYNTTNIEKKTYVNNNATEEKKPYNNNYNNGSRPYNNNASGEQRPYNNNGAPRPYNNNYNNGPRPYNNNNGAPRPYNNNYNNGPRPYNNNASGEQRPYNNNNGAPRPYNNNYNNGPRPYNNNASGEQRPYNNNNGGPRPYNNYNNGPRPYNNASGEQRPYNNNNGAPRPYNNYNNGSRPYNNNGGGRFNNTPMNQVDKFMKQSADDAPLEQKETRDYSLTLIDKKKYNNNSQSTTDGKKTAINKNELRELQARVATSKLKGLEVNSASPMLDLYERETDSIRKNNRKRRERKPVILNQTKIIPMTEVKLPETMTVKEFSESIKKQASEVIKKLFALGILATVNQEIDFDTAFLIAEEFGIKAEKHIAVTEEDILFDDSEDSDVDMVSRPPIVVVMGHVDHGKTSLLDRIRSAHVVTGEAGGITQHIGAYKVVINKKEICFLDTPGHEAFTEMRARGAHITDIAVIVVAADDGIKPQTIEAIDHAKAAEVSIIVAINKIDKPGANIEKVKQELLEVGLVPEEWGGDTICVPISATTGEGVDSLLEMILLTAEMKEFKANPNKQAKGTVIEAKLDKNIGTVTSLLVQRGTLNVGDTIVVGDIVGKVRAMKDDKGKKVKIAGPSTPVEIIGLGSVPQTGDTFYEVENEKVAKQLVDKRKADVRRNLVKQGSKVTLEDLFGQIKEGEIKDLNVIVKADVQGTLEALKNSLEKIANDEVKVRVIHAATGGIKESDVTLASVSNAIIIGFNVKPESIAVYQAEKEKVDLRLYSIIYDAINDVEVAMKGMLKPIYKEVIHGQAEVRATFKVSNVGTIAGCYVKSGSILRNTLCRVIRDSIILVSDEKIDSLKREKDDAKEVKENYECGIKLEKFNDINEGDIIECYEMVEEKRK